MSLSPAVLDAMLAAGCTAEQIVAAVKASNDDDLAREQLQREANVAAMKAKREADAARKRRQRANDVTVGHADSDGHGVTGTDNEDFPLPSKEGPQTPKETQPTLPTTQQEKTPKGVQKKGSRLPPDWVLPEGWGRDAIEAGLPANRIDLEAAKMRDWSLSSKAGVKLDWRATWRNWCREAASRPPPRGSPPLQMTDFLGTVIEQQERRNAGPDQEIEGAPQALRAIPGGRWSG